MMKKIILFAFCFTAFFVAEAGGPLGQAADKVWGYFGDAIKLMYALAAICGVVGAIKVYNKFNRGEPDIWQAVASWIGGGIFIAVAGLILESFFKS